MKTIVCKTPEISFYTYINQWLPSVCDNENFYNFALTNIETNFKSKDLEKWITNRLDIEYWIPEETMFELSLKDDIQFIWGTFSAVPKEKKIETLTIDHDYCINGNSKLFKRRKSKFIKESVFEVISFDSSLFIIDSDKIDIHKRIRSKYQNAKMVV